MSADLSRHPIHLGRGATAVEQPEFAINPPGVWHTADVTGRTTAVFITAGAGTQGRPR